jgi:hypothetical protein
VLAEPAVVVEVLLFEARPPGRLLLEDVRRYVLETGARVFRLDVEVFLPVISQVVQALLEVLPAVLHEESHHAFLVDGPGAEPQFLGAVLTEEDQLARLAVLFVSAVLATRCVFGGPRGARVAGNQLRGQDAASGTADLVSEYVLDRLDPVNLHIGYPRWRGLTMINGDPLLSN